MVVGGRGKRGRRVGGREEQEGTKGEGKEGQEGTEGVADSLVLLPVCLCRPLSSPVLLLLFTTMLLEVELLLFVLLRKQLLESESCLIHSEKPLANISLNAASFPHSVF